MEQKYKVDLVNLQNVLNLTPIYIPEDSEGKTVISTADVNRPGLALADFYGYFDQNRIQLLGKAEYNYLEGFSDDERSRKIEKLFTQNIPAVIITHGLEPLPEIVKCAEQYKIPLLLTSESTSSTMSALISYLSVELAPRVTRHGVLVEVYGEGILILGESGVGKSETAIELLKRGHRLVADDAVEIKRVSDRTLVGSSPEIIRHLIELRGIGIVDVRRLFGMGAVKTTEKVDLIIQLEPWNEQKQYDRLGLESDTYELLGLKIPTVTIPIKPGRNLAIIIEVAAMNSRQKKMGYNAAEELNKRLQNQMGVSLN